MGWGAPLGTVTRQMPSSATSSETPNDTVSKAVASTISNEVKSIPAATQYSPACG